MEKTRCNSAKIATGLLAVLLFVSVLAVLSNFASTTSAQTDYGDIMQYEWPKLGSTEGETRFNAGPAPDKPELLWTSTHGAIYSVFNGMAFSTSNNRLWAMDAFTGADKWDVPLTHGGSNPNKIDDDYLFVDSTRGVAVYRISNGALVSHLNYTIPNEIIGWNNPGGGSYYPGTYSPEMKMKYRVAFNCITNESLLVAFSLADPLNPRVAWEVKSQKVNEVHCTGEGLLFVGTYSGYSMDAYNGTTGELVWSSPKKGICGYTAIYYDGVVYHAGGTRIINAWDAKTGEELWEYDNGIGRWYVHGMMAAYGRIYMHTVIHLERPTGVPEGEYQCFDAKTGELLWKTQTNYMGGYWTPAVADGKVYAMIVDSPNWAGLNPLVSEGSTPYTWAAFDAFTGSILWKCPQGVTVSNFIVAYGNLYAGTTVLGDKDTSMEYWRGSYSSPGVATGEYAPTDVTKTKWAYETDGAITSSPVGADGKIYFGSYDKNWYCVDAETGSLIWKFPTGFECSSTVALAGGRVFTGPDDGYVYCINADTGEEVWKTNIYAGNLPAIQFEVDTAQVRSSPIVIGSRLYVGALDGKLYCINTSNGNVAWTYTTRGPIGGSPVYSNGIIYIASTDRQLYAIDTTGVQVWNWTTPQFSPSNSSRNLFFVGTPTVADGKLWIGAGGRSLNSPPRVACLNATTGEQIWLVVTDPEGNSNHPYAMTYWKGLLFSEAHMSAVALNATDGSEVWDCWIGHQVYSSPLVVDGPSGARVYYGANSYSIHAFDANTGYPISWYTTQGQVYSSPAVYNGRLYYGSADRKLYCVDDTPVVPTSIWADSDKGEAMWNNETVTFSGQLLGTTVGTVWYDLETMVDVNSDLRMGLPNATVVLSVTKPDFSSENVTATTDDHGFFTLSYSPSVVGDWGWVVYYEGEDKGYVVYDGAFGEYSTFSVTSPSEPSGEPLPPPAGVPVELVYGAVAAIVIVLVAVGAYVLLKRRK